MKSEVSNRIDFANDYHLQNQYDYLLQFPIGNAKCAESFKFQNDAPILKYCKKTLNSCCLSGLESDFASINHFNAANAISMYIEEYLKSKVGNNSDITNAILKNVN